MKPAILAALCCSTLYSSTACAPITPVETQQLLDCASEAGQSEWSTIQSTVNSALNGQGVNWQSTLDTALTNLGPGVVCGVEVALQNLEHSSARTGTDEVAMVRAQAWLTSGAKYKLVK